MKIRKKYNYLKIRNLIRNVFHDELDLFQLVFCNIAQNTSFRGWGSRLDSCCGGGGGGSLFAFVSVIIPVELLFAGHRFEETRPVSAPIHVSRVLFEKGSLHPPLFRLQFAESILGKGFALTPFLLGQFVMWLDACPAFFHAPSFVHKETLVLLEATARALILRLAALDGPSFEFASRRRVLDRHSVSIVAFSSFTRTRAPMIIKKRISTYEKYWLARGGRRCERTFVAIGNIFDDVEFRKVRGWHFASLDQVRVPPGRSAFDLLLLKETKNGGAVHVRWHGNTGNLEKRRSQIHVANQTLDHPAASDARPANQKWDSNVRLERERLAYIAFWRK